jgi:UDP-glucose 4-epimerase
VDRVIHFAGLKAVGQSVAESLSYWDLNASGSQHLLTAMTANGCRTLMFISSATLYGYPKTGPIPESAPIQPTNSCAYTKAAVEQCQPAPDGLQFLNVGTGVDLTIRELAVGLTRNMSLYLQALLGQRVRL